MEDIFRGKLDCITGYDIRVNDSLCVEDSYIQFRFPRSKKKRIRKKFLKDNNNFKTEKVHSIIKYQNTIIISSKVYEKLKKVKNHEK